MQTAAEKALDKRKLTKGLIALTVPVLVMVFGLLYLVDGIGQRESKVPWAGAGSIRLAASPSEFRVDPNQKLVSYRGLPGGDTEQELQALINDADAQGPIGQSYYAAIDNLMFDASRANAFATVILLGLAGLAGVLGVQTRSITNFVGHACFKGDLNLPRWWPYYVIRPLTGFVLGLVVVLVVKSGILTVPGDAASSLWWVSLAFLAGFGEDEFRQRLRVVSKALFGEVDAKDLAMTSRLTQRDGLQ